MEVTHELFERFKFVFDPTPHILAANEVNLCTAHYYSCNSCYTCYTPSKVITLEAE